MSDREALIADALGRSWYHTIDLAPGRATPGAVDVRPLAPKVLPGRLDGLRALDVGTFDGFWAFALEQRGAEVVATDLERFDQSQWPPRNRAALAAEAGDGAPGERFGLAAEILGSRVRRVVSSVADLDADRLGGPVDYAVVGDLLIHVRDPVGALERVHGVLRPGGRVLSLEQIDVALTLRHPRTPAAHFQANSTRMNWWQPSVRAHRGWLRAAGFADVRLKRIYKLRAHGHQAKWHAAFEGRRV